MPARHTNNLHLFHETSSSNFSVRYEDEFYFFFHAFSSFVAWGFMKNCWLDITLNNYKKKMCKLVVEPLSGEYDYFTYLVTYVLGGTENYLHLKYDIQT